MVAKSGSAAGMKPSRAPAQEPAARGGSGGRIVLAIGIAIATLVVLAIAGWAVWGLLDRAAAPTPDMDELRALDTKLTSIESAMKPIAVAFTSQPDSAPIDVTAYRDRIVAARRVVESVNDLSTTSPASLEIRDEILTGGTQVLDGMDSALDALTSDDASATESAGAQVEEGLTRLDEARVRLKELLGSTTRT